MWTIEEWAKQATGIQYHKDGKTYNKGGGGQSGIPLLLANVGYTGTEFMKLGNFQDYWQKWMREIGVSEKQSDDDSESDSESDSDSDVADLSPDEEVEDIDPGLTQAETPMFSDVSMATSRSKMRQHFSMAGYDTRKTKSRTALTRGDYRTMGQAGNLQYS